MHTCSLHVICNLFIDCKASCSPSPVHNPMLGCFLFRRISHLTSRTLLLRLLHISNDHSVRRVETRTNEVTLFTSNPLRHSSKHGKYFSNTNDWSCLFLNCTNIVLSSHSSNTVTAHTEFPPCIAHRSKLTASRQKPCLHPPPL